MEGTCTEVVIERNNITLRCVGVGYPPPLVQWRKLNGSLSDRVLTCQCQLMKEM